MSLLVEAIEDVNTRAAIVGPQDVVTVPIRELERLRDAITNLISSSRARLETKRISAMDKLKELVAGNYGITVEEMVGRSKFECICWPRQLCMYFAREMGHFSFREIAQSFGHRDHAAVIYAVRAVKDRMRTPKTKAEVDNLRWLIERNAVPQFTPTSEDDNVTNPKS